MTTVSILRDAKLQKSRLAVIEEAPVDLGRAA